MNWRRRKAATADVQPLQINRVYCGPNIPMTAAAMKPGEIVVNIGLVAAHITPAQALELQRAIVDARLTHDVLYGVIS